MTLVYLQLLVLMFMWAAFEGNMGKALIWYWMITALCTFESCRDIFWIIVSLSIHNYSPGAPRFYIEDSPLLPYLSASRSHLAADFFPPSASTAFWRLFCEYLACSFCLADCCSSQILIQTSVHHQTASFPVSEEIRWCFNLLWMFLWGSVKHKHT